MFPLRDCTCDLLTCVQSQLSEPLEEPIFATRNDPAELTRAVFINRPKGQTPPPEDALTSDAPFNALVQGIREVDPFMQLREEEERSKEQTVPDGLERVLGGMLLLLLFVRHTLVESTHSVFRVACNG